MVRRRCSRGAAAALLLWPLAGGSAHFAPRSGWLVVHTWPWTGVADAAAAVLAAGGGAVDAAVAGATAAERDPLVDSVGRGAHADAAGETTLDALVMDGDSCNVGAVGALRRVAGAAAAARLVLLHSSHSLLVGSQASDFAAAFGGMPLESLSSNASDAAYDAWRGGGCQARCALRPRCRRRPLTQPADACACGPTWQPNYYVDTAPQSSSGCGPFRPAGAEAAAVQRAPRLLAPVTPSMHDTVSVAALDARGALAVATSTNGLAFKLPGRVGDGAVAGGGSYARSAHGACGATGDGDVMMRFLPCYQVVESMRLGWSPKEAARDALARIAQVEPAFTGALFALAPDGRHAGAAHNWVFQYTVRGAGDDAATVVTVQPMGAADVHAAAALRRRRELRAARGDAAPLAAAFAAGAVCAAAAARFTLRSLADAPVEEKHAVAHILHVFQPGAFQAVAAPGDAAVAPRAPAAW